mmetsp:Transcript_18505/g.35223  ORF Transcript_18505/g.35223 Transcript_18505/m.35223 type:complete len:441 (-) Transcript_18505:1511-2833(-)
MGEATPLRPPPFLRSADPSASLGTAGREEGTRARLWEEERALERERDVDCRRPPGVVCGDAPLREDAAAEDTPEDMAAERTPPRLKQSLGTTGWLRAAPGGERATLEASESLSYSWYFLSSSLAPLPSSASSISTSSFKSPVNPRPLPSLLSLEFEFELKGTVKSGSSWGGVVAASPARLREGTQLVGEGPPGPACHPARVLAAGAGVWADAGGEGAVPAPRTPPRASPSALLLSVDFGVPSLDRAMALLGVWPRLSLGITGPRADGVGVHLRNDVSESSSVSKSSSAASNASTSSFKSPVNATPPSCASSSSLRARRVSLWARLLCREGERATCCLSTAGLMGTRGLPSAGLGLGAGVLNESCSLLCGAADDGRGGAERKGDTSNSKSISRMRKSMMRSWWKRRFTSEFLLPAKARSTLRCRVHSRGSPCAPRSGAYGT